MLRRNWSFERSTLWMRSNSAWDSKTKDLLLMQTTSLPFCSLVFPLDVFDKVIGIVAPFPNQVGSKRCSNYFVQRDKDVRSSEYKLQEDYFCSEYPSLGRNTPGSSEHKTNPSTSSVFSLPKECLLRLAPAPGLLRLWLTVKAEGTK